jgi:chloramphenicol O-acetyltransferase type A
MRADQTFGFSLMEFTENMQDFATIVSTEIDRIQTTTGIITTEYPENLIHFSALPWIDFTSLSHARSFTWPDSCPKISFGKLTVENGKKTIPVSVHVHHGLVDGYHVGLFLEKLQELL